MENLGAQPATPPASRVRVNRLAVLRSADFRKLWVANNLSLVGDFFSYVALAWLVLQLTGSSLALGGVLVAQAVPRSVLMLVGGALVDRVSARVTMLGSMGLRIAVVGPLAVLVLTGHVQMWEVYLASFVFGVVDAFFLPARAAILPRLVDDRDLEPANALLTISSQASIVVGPALAGLVVAGFGTGWAFAADATCFAVGLPLVLWLPAIKPAPSATPAARGMGGQIVAGFRYAWSDLGIRAVLLIIAAFDFAANGAIGVGLPTLAHGRFDAGAIGLGFLYAAWGLGAVLGAALAGIVPPPRRFGWMVVIGLAWIGLAVLATGLVPTLLPAVAILATAGISSGVVNTYGISWLQRRTEPSMQGRVMSLVMLASIGLVPIGYAAAGILAQASPTLLFVIAGGVMVIAASGAAISRTVRSL
ncbi:MAG TPA: MFS transporter [Candidatus Dormibacteraeota bacterium]|nr:MFS transporter [Candidatus Dormibacteraeota bacterium]